MTSKRIKNLILLNLQQFGINTQYLHGHLYNKVAAKAGKLNGVQMHYMFIVLPTP